MAFLKDINTIYQQLVTDHVNLHGQQPGLISRIKYSCLASGLWGIYKKEDETSKSAVPGNSSGDTLTAWAALWGIPRLTGESDSALLARLLVRLRTAPAGGNRSDWEEWAKGETYLHDEGEPTEWTEGIRLAKCIENARGIGTINLVVQAMNLGTGADVELSTELHDQIVAVIDDGDHRPIGTSDWLLVTATPVVTDVTMILPGATTETCAAVTAQVIALLNSLGIGTKLYVAQLASISVENGIENPTISEPLGTVDPTASGLISTTAENVSITAS